MFLSLFVILSPHTQAGIGGTSGVGNGGDPVRDEFFSVGHNILNNYANGFHLIEEELKRVGVSDFQQLANLLTIATVKTSKDILIDNQGSIVSAISEKNSIQLYIGNELPNLNWHAILMDKFKGERMVLHELLRAVGINDDNFVFTNIVLKDQGRILNSEFNFYWSQRNKILIDSIFANSFHSKSIDSELSIFRGSIDKLIAQNNLKVSELLKVNLEFMQNLDESSDPNNEKGVLSLYRVFFRTTKKLNLILDQFLNALMTQDSRSHMYFNRYLLLSLRQISTSQFYLKEIDRGSLHKYIQGLLQALNNPEYAHTEFSVLRISMVELLGLIEGPEKIDLVLRKISQIVRAIQTSLNQVE